MNTSITINKNLLFKVIEAVSYIFRKNSMPPGELSSVIKDPVLLTTKSKNPLNYSVLHSTSYKIITKWKHDIKYGYVKLKKTLPLDSSDASFKTLVQEVDPNINYFEVLNNLISAGVIDYSASEKQVKLIKLEYIPLNNQDEIIKILQNDISDLISSVTKNLSLPQNLVHHQLRTEYDKIPKSKEEEIRQWISQKASKLHREIGEYLSSLDIDSVSGNSSSEGTTETITVSVSSFSNIKNNFK